MAQKPVTRRPYELQIALAISAGMAAVLFTFAWVAATFLGKS